MCPTTELLSLGSGTCTCGLQDAFGKHRPGAVTRRTGAGWAQRLPHGIETYVEADVRQSLKRLLFKERRNRVPVGGKCHREGSTGLWAAQDARTDLLMARSNELWRVLEVDEGAVL